MNAIKETGTTSKKSSKSKVRLIDCFMEIITYTLYAITDLNQSQPDFVSIQGHFETLLERSAKSAKKGKISSTDWKKACFPICAWVDEKVLCSDWTGKSQWQQNLLQLKFFQTTMAGREFFKRLNQLKENDQEIREVFTYALALGYSGQFYSNEDKMQLSEIKVENLLKYFSDDQEMNLPEQLFPEAYQKQSRITGKPKFRFLVSSVSDILIVLLPPIMVFAAYIIYYEKLQNILARLL